MAIHSSILAWRIPWTEEPGGLQSMGLQKVGHGSLTNIITFSSKTGHGLFFKVILVKPRNINEASKH